MLVERYKDIKLINKYMKTNSKFHLIFFILVLTLSSCVSRKQLTYLQYSGTSSAKDLRATVTPAVYKILPFDNLYIRVLTPDPKWSELFNTMPSGQGSSITQESAGLLAYPVDESGNIEIPFVGKLDVAGKTLSEIKINLDSIFQKYVKDAFITVRIVDNYLSIVGEVRQPGRYPITKDRLNIFEAISMAGDLSEFSNRQTIQLIRPSKYGPIVKEFSLIDRGILTSEFFYVMPNDIIYVQPLKGRAFQMNSSIYSIILSSVATILTSITTLLVIFRM
jgi:polysaccharide export outer membrane protein